MPAPTFLYFSLENPLPMTMIAGQRYQVNVFISSERLGDPTEKRVLRRPNLQLEVRPVGDNWVSGSVTRPVVLSEGESFACIELVLTPTNEAAEVVLELAISGSLLAQQQIVIQGAQPNRATVTETRTPHLGESPVATPLPPNFASLSIRRDDQSWLFALRTAEWRVKSGPVPAWTNTEAVSLETLFVMSADRDTLKGNGIQIANDLPTTIRTHLEILAARGTVLQIVDLTRTGIPWELAYLENVPGFLGALCAVVRRTVASVGEATGGATTTDAVAFTFSESGAPGEVLAFLADPAHLAGVDPERQILQQFCSKFYEQRASFLTSLEEAEGKIAVVYVASHGEVVQGRPNQATLWLAQEEEITAIQLLSYSLQLVATARPLIFVNACYSAWMGPFLGNEHFGLPSPFLRRQARGYLGAVGKVHTNHAADFARRFFEKLQAHPEAPVAEILRVVRQAMIEECVHLSSTEAGRCLLDAFMYVYYGIPFLQIQIRPVTGEGGQ